MRLSKLIEDVGEYEIACKTAEWDREIDALSMDSRKNVSGSLFICVNGESVDSHTRVLEAEKNGAIAIVAERIVQTSLPIVLVKDTRKALGRLASAFYGEPSKRLKIIGITGTNGKTTTSYILASILEAAGKKVGVIGTLGIAYAGKHISPTLTTPDALELHACFADMVAEGIECVVMEVSAHALYYKKTEGIVFSACIFTNFTQDHLDFFKTMERYKKAKMSLFSSMDCPIAIVNGDDETGREIGRMREKNGLPVMFYGLTTPTDCFAIITEAGLKGTDCVFNLNDKLYRARIRLIGEYNVYNALAAGVCAEAMQCEKGISTGIYRVRNVCGRLQKVGATHGAEIFVDFAHTPDGLKKSLETLKKHCACRLVCLFGCGGNRDKSKRAIMGEIAAKYCDFSILTSDNPRYEDPLDIIGEIERGHRRFSNRYVIIPDRGKAIEYALDFVANGDILLITGKGGEETQEIMGIKYPFNDQNMVVKLLQQKGTM